MYDFIKDRRSNSLQIKDIISKFEVTRATLHNWKRTKPNLYDYLFAYKNQNNAQKHYRELTIILQKYAKESIDPIFSYEEIYFLYKKEFGLEDAQNLQSLFIHSCKDEFEDNFEYIIDIYNKIKNLNIVEKYILSSKLKKLKESREIITKGYIVHHFKEFLQSS